ncbi:MAG: translation initiation factor IF-2 N-terminal domain-containing protein, partial [Acidimicrobiales bacterium]
MAKNIRVYELARELGLTNKEALDLAVSLGIGVKSHSSSIEDAQADRVRRKAEREGLIRATTPEPPTPAFEPERPVVERRPPEPEPVPEVHRVVRSRPASELGDAAAQVTQRPVPVRP